MSRKILMFCSECSKPVEKLIKEVNRRRRVGCNNFFCNQSCATIYAEKFRSEEYRQNRLKRIKSFQSSPPPKEKKGNFTYYLKKIRDRIKNKDPKGRFQEWDVDEKILQEIWDKQKGLCAISSLSLTLQNFNTRKSPYSASLDRIDSKKGYLKDNVQFVCYSLNMAKNDFNQETILAFVQDLRKVDHL